MPEPLRIRGSNAKTCLIEHLVEKRVRTLEYFRQLHTRDDVLWLNSIRIGRVALGEYFGVDRTVLQVGTSAATSAANKVAIRHTRTESVGSAATSQQSGRGATTAAAAKPAPRSSPPPSRSASFGVSSGADDPVMMVPLRHVDGLHSSVSSDWLEEYMPKFFALGTSLSELLLVPMSGPSFVDCVYQLLLELDVYFASGHAARVLAGRALKSHRYTKAQCRLGADAGNDTPAPIVSAKPQILCEQLLQYAVDLPSYDTIIHSLCTTVIFTYRRMCDFDAIENSESIKQILQVDRRLKRLFFGNLSKEINSLAKGRLVQQAILLTEHLFGAFSQADDSLVTELLRKRTEAVDAGAGVAPSPSSTTPWKHVDPAGAPRPAPLPSDDDDDDEYA